MIERIDIYKAAENNKAIVDDIMVMVKKSDLDALETANQVLQDDKRVFVNECNELRKEKIKLKEQNQEMLEALIEIVSVDYYDFVHVGDYEEWRDTYKKELAIIEKVSGKTWEQIKAGKE